MTCAMGVTWKPALVITGMVMPNSERLELVDHGRDPGEEVTAPWLRIEGLRKVRAQAEGCFELSVPAFAVAPANGSPWSVP